MQPCQRSQHKYLPITLKHNSAQNSSVFAIWGPLDINSVEASSCEWSLADFAALLQIFEQKMQ